MYTTTRGENFGPEVKRRIMLGTFALSTGYYDAYYDKAQKVRQLIRDDYVKAFADVDLIITPTSPTAAFKLGEKADDPLAMYLSDILTTPASLAGLPAISVPCGRISDGRPVGLQITGPAFSEEKILAAAGIVEQMMEDGHAEN
jgi:aspartyl-tRNA(Asn)/glutamyl-tRNA(Gln) amidotransferase subunit A